VVLPLLPSTCMQFHVLHAAPPPADRAEVGEDFQLHVFIY